MIRIDFAGPGGWDEGLRLLGHQGLVLGLENDEHAAHTALAAGHVRLLADVRDELEPGPLDGYIASPVCRPFAQSGKGASVAHLSHLIDAADLVATGDTPDEAVQTVQDDALDERAVLSLVPLAVIREARPGWVALEQVPRVLPLWEHYAAWLRRWGYDTWTGLVRAEQYGVPQVRERAVLLASRLQLQGGSVADAQPLPSARAGPARPGRAAVGDDDAGPRAPAAARCARRRSHLGGPSAEPAIVGTFRPEVVAAPGYRKAGDPSRQNTPGSVLITQPEAGILQGFRRDYPWRGPDAARWRQAGDAVPPPLAAALLRCLL